MKKIYLQIHILPLNVTSLAQIITLPKNKTNKQTNKAISTPGSHTYFVLGVVLLVGPLLFQSIPEGPLPLNHTESPKINK